MPEGVMVPTEEFPPATAFTCQLTARLEAFRTLTRNCTLAPGYICAEAGETLTVTTGAGLTLLFVEAPPPPLHEICWAMAISTRQMALARNLELGDRRRTRE